MPPGTIDPRVRSDGAYVRDQRTGRLHRCLGERLLDGGGGTRVGYEDVLDPSDVRWVTKRAGFAQRLRFVTQGEASAAREVVEAMR